MRVIFKLFSYLIPILLLGNIDPVISQPFFIKKFTVNDGLPASYIFKIFQDSNGFIWVGTFNGLSRFDGREFINYSYDNGMPHIIVDAMYEDHGHHLWIGTRGGMAEIMGSRCLVYPTDDGQAINFVYSFKEFSDHTLWALTSKGIYSFKTDHWQKEKLCPGFENHGCIDIVDYENGLLINYGHELVLKKKDGSYQIISRLTNDETSGPVLRYMFKEGKKLFLYRTDGIFEIDGNDTTELFHGELHNKNIVCVLKDKQGRFWVYTLNDKLMVSSPGNTTRFSYKIPVRLVSSLFEDREGNMWVAASDGLLKYKPVNYESYDSSNDPRIRGFCSIVKNSENNILISVANGQILDYHHSIFKNCVLSNTLHNRDAHSEIIDAHCYDDSNRLWLIFREQLGLYCLEKNNLRFYPGLVHGNIHPLTGIAWNKNSHELFVGADTLQVGDVHSLQNFRSLNGERFIVNPVALHYFPNHRMLVDTRNSGFFIIDEKKNIYPVPQASIPSNTPGGAHIFDDPSGKFWIASASGLTRYRWDKQLMPVKDLEVTTRTGLPNSTVLSVAFDKLNRIWAVTLSGVVVIQIDSTDHIIVNRLSEEQGITTNFWSEVKLCNDNEGNMWVGLMNRIIKFDPSDIHFDNSAPSIVIDKVQLNSKETDWQKWSDSINGITQVPFEAALPYDKNNLEIFYKGISFSSPAAVEYSYQLIGADHGWSSPTHTDFVSLIGLRPGNYTFRVKAKKSNSDWSQPAEFNFIILKPYWETWWFRSLVFVVFASLILAIYKYRVNQMKKLMDLRLKISRDLHDEIGSTLSGIGLMSEIAKKQLANKSENEVKSSLEKISSNSEETLGKMSDIVWAINPHNDTYEKMIDRLRNFARNTAIPIGIQVNFDIEKNLSQFNLDMQRRNNIYLICKEAINNAIRYSGCKNLNFLIKTEDHQMNIAIADDGRGFDEQQVYNGNGLKNMRARAEEIKIDLRIHSEKEKGTTISLAIKSPD